MIQFATDLRTDSVKNICADCRASLPAAWYDGKPASPAGTTHCDVCGRPAKIVKTIARDALRSDNPRTINIAACDMQSIPALPEQISMDLYDAVRGNSLAQMRIVLTAIAKL